MDIAEFTWKTYFYIIFLQRGIPAANHLLFFLYILYLYFRVSIPHRAAVARATRRVAKRPMCALVAGALNASTLCCIINLAKVAML